MDTKTVIEANVDGFEFGDWDDATCDFTPIERDNLEEMAKKYGCTPELLELILDNFSVLKEDLLIDLRDIWKKVDKS